jgi:hypothetical protein
VGAQRGADVAPVQYAPILVALHAMCGKILAARQKEAVQHEEHFDLNQTSKTNQMAQAF